jgi:hypothetical protein
MSDRSLSMQHGILSNISRIPPACGSFLTFAGVRHGNCLRFTAAFTDGPFFDHITSNISDFDFDYN